MPPPAVPIELARRMALHAQGLAIPPAAGTGVAEAVERIGCLQLDPVSAVARSPLLVLRARLRGGSHSAHLHALEQAAYDRREVFEYWCHEASLCHVSDLPLHRWAMRTHIDRLSPGRGHRARWLEANSNFAKAVEATLRARGPVAARKLEDESSAAWEWGHWTDEISSRQTIARLMDLLWLTGRIGVADRAGPGRRWDLIERCLPDGALSDVDFSLPSHREIVQRAAVRSIRMLGLARTPHINAHFTRRRYPGLATELAHLEQAGEIERVRIAGLRGEWWGHSEDLERAGRLEPGGRTIALSPFDNVLCDRARALELFGFDHRLEIYVPEPKRRWGYYVLPILHRERFVARADLRVEGEQLRVLSLHHEKGRRAPQAVQRALRGLARWRGVSPTREL